jgi:hypothetical protein
LSKEIRLNEDSTLEREYITIIDSSLPLAMTKCAGVGTFYKRGEQYSAGGYSYETTCYLNAIEDIQAYRVIYLTFDIWGNHVRTLSATDIRDISAGTFFEKHCEWKLFDENEACQHYASIAYVSLVRMANGTVISGNQGAALAEAQRFSVKFKEEDLEPTKPSR